MGNESDRILQVKNGLLENAKDKNALLKRKLEQVHKKVVDAKFDLEDLDLRKDKIKKEIEQNKKKSDAIRLGLDIHWN